MTSIFYYCNKLYIAMKLIIEVTKCIVAIDKTQNNKDNLLPWKRVSNSLLQWNL